MKHTYFCDHIYECVCVDYEFEKTEEYYTLMMDDECMYF